MSVEIDSSFMLPLFEGLLHRPRKYHSYDNYQLVFNVIKVGDVTRLARGVLGQGKSSLLLVFVFVGMDDTNQEDLFRCAICGTTEGDSSNLTSQTTLQTNATVRCGHQLYVHFLRGR